MTTKLTVRGATQSIQEQTLIGNRNDIGTTVITLYTVPAGKKARIIGATRRFISGGANTLLDIDMGGERVVRDTAVPSPPIDQDIPTVKNMVLVAGETIELSGDSGSDNGSMNFWITYEELPV